MNADMNTKFSELATANLRFNDRFTEMPNAIESLRTTSPSRPMKFYKEAPRQLDNSTFYG